MQCPACHLSIPDNVAICPLCDAILDESFLDASTEPGADTAPAAGWPATPAAPDEPPPLASPRKTAEDLSGQSDGTNILAFDPESHKETRIVRMEDLPKRRVGPAASTAPTRGGATAAAPEDDLGDVFGRSVLAVRRLRKFEKIAFFLLVAQFVAAFAPWYNARGVGYISGIERIGIWAATATGAALVVFWIRVTYRWTLLVLAQVALVLLAAGVAALGLRVPAGVHPSAGIYLALGLGLATAVASLVAAVKS